LINKFLKKKILLGIILSALTIMGFQNCSNYSSSMGDASLTSSGVSTYTLAGRSDSEFVFNNQEIQIQNGVITLAPNFVVPHKLDSLIGWEIYNTTNLAPNVPVVEPNGQIRFDCNNGWGGLRFVGGPDYTDYIAYYETTIDSWYSGAKHVLSMSGRVTSGANLVTLGIWNATVGANDFQYRIHRWENSAATSLAQVNAPIDILAGTTYATKAKFEGKTYSFKVWDVKTPEPTTWNTTASDGGQHPTGKLGFSCNSSIGVWKNLKVYAVNEVSDYSTSVQTVLLPEIRPDGKVTKWGSFSASVQAANGNQVRFDISTDGGANFLTFRNGAWLRNISGFSEAITAYDLDKYLGSLDVSDSRLLIRVYLSSSDGTSTPSLSDLKLTYTQ
jgi:hypothetical protein